MNINDENKQGKNTHKELNTQTSLAKSILNRFREIIRKMLFLNDGFDGNYQGLKPPIKVFGKNKSSGSTITDWLQAIDVLQPKIAEYKSRIEPAKTEHINWEWLGVTTYLYHVEQLLKKIREQILQYKYRRSSYEDKKEIINKSEFIQAHQACVRCYNTIFIIINILDNIKSDSLHCDDLISQIHALELETSSLTSAIRNLNQLVYKLDAMLQISQLENDLLTVIEPQKPNLDIDFTVLSELKTRQVSDFENGNDLSQLNKEIIKIKSKSYRHIAYAVLEAYTMLKKCYIVNNKAMINKSLNSICDDVHSLIGVLSEDEVPFDIACAHLSSIYRSIEAIRFRTNNESPCSKRLHDKTKLARHQIRRSCEDSDLGKEFLKSVSIRRDIFSRNKKC